jgi:hypothetical protein
MTDLQGNSTTGMQSVDQRTSVPLMWVGASIVGACTVIGVIISVLVIGAQMVARETEQDKDIEALQKADEDLKQQDAYTMLRLEAARTEVLGQIATVQKECKGLTEKIQKDTHELLIHKAEVTQLLQSMENTMQAQHDLLKEILKNEKGKS